MNAPAQLFGLKLVGGSGPWAPALEPAPSVRRGPRGGAATGSIELVVLGASAGGPPAIESLLRGLGEELAVPLVIAQHMPATFTRSFAQRLDACLPQRVREAGHLEELQDGVVYIAPGDRDLRVERHCGRLRAVLAAPAAAALYRPSVDLLFTSAGDATHGNLLAVLLTGMGTDGAVGMAQLAGDGVHTIAQDCATSAIFGMPRAAIMAGGAVEVLPLPLIAYRLRLLLAAPPALRAPHPPVRWREAMEISR
jgi:two-component system chemotaxis response regulator CheB